MDDRQKLITEIEQAAAELGIATTTLCLRAGQGGHFHKRLLAGRRYWPETAQSVRDWIASARGNG